MKLDHIYYGDCNNVIKTFPAQSIDMVVTSSPYKNEDGFDLGLLKDVAGTLHKILKNDSACFINFGQLAGYKMRPFEVAATFLGAGFFLLDTIIWVKNHYRPIQGKHRLNNLFEYIFMFVKGSPVLDRLAIGVPYADLSNAKRFNDGLNLKCRGNVWHIPYETIRKKEQKLHNDRFPVELPQLCIRLACPLGGIVLDPFIGSGSTAIAAIREGAHYIGIDCNQKCVEVANKRVMDEVNKERNFSNG